MPRWLLVALIPALVTFSGGLIEMRVAVGRMETRMADIDKRVERIENRLDSNARTSSLSDDGE